MYNIFICNGEHKNGLEQNEEMFVKEDYSFRVRARAWREGTLRDTRKLKGSEGPLEDHRSKEETTTDSELGVGVHQFSEGTELEDQALVNATKKEEKFWVCGKEAAIWWQMFKEQEFSFSGHKWKSHLAIILKEEMVRSVRSLMRVPSHSLVFVESRVRAFPFAWLCVAHILSLMAREGLCCLA